MLKTSKIKTLIDFFDKNKKEETNAILEFYKIFLKKNQENNYYRLMDKIDHYIKSGFMINEDHLKIIGQDPFTFLWNNNYYIDAYYGKTAQDNGLSLDHSVILEYLWDNCFDNKYKKKVIKEQPIIPEFMIYMLSLNDKLIMGETKKYLRHPSLIKFYNDKIFDPELLKEKDRKNMETGVREFQDFFMDKGELYIDYIKAGGMIVKTICNYNEQPLELDRIFGKKSEEDIIKESILDKYKDTLKQIEKNYKAINEKETSHIIANITENLKLIIEHPNFEKEVEKKFMVDNIINKKLPNLLSSYTEIPEKLRNNSNSNSPTQLYIETLKNINEKIEDNLKSIYEDKIVELKVNHKISKIK